MGFFFMPNFTPIDAGIGVWDPKTENFDEISEYKRPAGAYPLRDFHEICSIFRLFEATSAVKIWTESHKGLQRYGAFNLRELVSPKFSASLSGETIRQTPYF